MARITYLGSPSPAVEPLRALLAAGHEVPLVVSQPDRRRGRGSETSPTPVKAFALEQGLEVTDDLSRVGGVEAELAVVVAYGRLIPAAMLEAMPYLNLHFSLLPRWRGAAPVERAILAGDELTGVSIMQLEETLDTGPVYATATTEVGEASSTELLDRLAVMGGELLVTLLAAGVAGLPQPLPQVGEPTYAEKLSAEDFAITPDLEAVEMARRVRLGRASLQVAGSRLRVHAAHLVAGDPGDEPGTLLGTAICTRTGRLELDLVQPEGRRPVDAADWRRGARLDGVVHLEAASPR